MLLNTAHKILPTAYKILTPNWTCKGFKYEIGQTYEMDEKPIICKKGFHACYDLIDCLKYYDLNKENHFVEVELLGEIDIIIDKVCTNKIKIIRELDWEEALELTTDGKGNSGIGNEGKGNIGCNNVGNGNIGNDNNGNYNNGDCNYSDYNIGDCNNGNNNIGNYNNGHNNVGHCNVGSHNKGNYIIGSYNTFNIRTINGNGNGKQIFNNIVESYCYYYYIEIIKKTFEYSYYKDNKLIVTLKNNQQKEISLLRYLFTEIPCFNTRVFTEVTGFNFTDVT